MDDLSGRHALITGGGTGVGASIALALAHAGARVTIAGRRKEPLERTASRHERMRWVTGDVSDPRSVLSMFTEAVAAHGPADIVVANAGVAMSKSFLKMDASDLRSMLDANLSGVLHVWQAALPPMLDAGWGRLIAIASTAGLKGYAYVRGYTQTPMLEQAVDNIVRKTGRSRTEAEAALKASNPQGRFVQPEEVAQTVLWLCSAGAASVTGQAISVSGGEI